MANVTTTSVETEHARTGAPSRAPASAAVGAFAGLPMRVLARLPRPAAFACAAALGRRRFRRSHGALARHAYPLLRDAAGVDASRIHRVAELAFEHAACDELEYALFPRITRDNLSRYLELRGIDRLERALERGHGAILYSGHVRGHYMLFAALGLLGLHPNIVGMPVASDSPPSRRRVYERRDAVLRERMGCRFLYMAGDDFAVAARAANALRRNEVATFEIDHTHSGKNVDLPFLGMTAQFPVGPLLVARSTGAPLLHFWLHRPARRTPQVAEIGEPIHISEDIEASLAAVVAPLGESIRRHPESWATWLFPDVRLFTERI